MPPYPCTKSFSCGERAWRLIWNARNTHGLNVVRTDQASFGTMQILTLRFTWMFTDICTWYEKYYIPAYYKVDRVGVPNHPMARTFQHSWLYSLMFSNMQDWTQTASSHLSIPEDQRPLRHHSRRYPWVGESCHRELHCKWSCCLVTKWHYLR